MNKLTNEILNIKENKNITIISHYVLPLKIQEISDFVGDLYEIIEFCKKTDKKILFFCTPDFISDFASLLFPKLLILKPKIPFLCEHIKNITILSFNKLKKLFPTFKTLAYIKSPLRILELADYIVSDKNIDFIYGKIQDEKKVIFVPTYNYGFYLYNFKFKKKIEIVLPQTNCFVHNKSKLNEFEKSKEEFKDSYILVNPETNYKILDTLKNENIKNYSDAYNFIANSEHKKYLINYEKSFILKLKKDFPDKYFFNITKKYFKCFIPNNFNLKVLLDSIKNNFYPHKGINENIKFNLNKKLKELKVFNDL